MDRTLRTVISLSKPHPPHLGHRATIAQYVTPDGRKGEIAVTVCGRAIKNFTIVDQVSQTYTDGSQYWHVCPYCQAIQEDQS